jgi:membrane protein implicated in regulation of membrane protease activity
MHNLIEALGGLLMLIALGVLVAAAAMVSDVLGVLAAGVALLVVGMVVVYLASVLEERTKTAKPRAGDRA